MVRQKITPFLWFDGQAEEAVRSLEAALRLDPANLEVHLALARGYSEAGLTEEARRERQFCLEATRNEGNQVAR